MSRLQEVADTLQSMVGESQRHDHGVVDRRLIQRYAVAIDDRNPLYVDPEAARAAGHADVIAPPNMLAAVVDWGRGAWQDDLNADGTGHGGWLSDATRGIRVMGGGEEMVLHHPLVAGMQLSETQVLSDVVLKQGRSGSLMLIISDVQFSAGDGLLLSTSRRTVLGRPPVGEV